jgi:hypothetical protein
VREISYDGTLARLSANAGGGLDVGRKVPKPSINPQRDEHPGNGIRMHAQLLGDGAYAPSLDMVVRRLGCACRGNARYAHLDRRALRHDIISSLLRGTLMRHIILTCAVGAGARGVVPATPMT